MDPLALPQDIILLICQELAARRDFVTLFRCSLVSHRVASISLEQLYRMRGDVHESFHESRLAVARLWRSIILSSVGKTAYPYCTYVRALSLGDLEESLEDARGIQDVRAFFFDHDMKEFLVLKDGLRLTDATPSAPFVPIDIGKTMIKCADSITRYIKDSADDNEKAVALAHLEGYFIPHDILPGWITRLGTLTSLRLRDGSVLGVEAASALSECCPNFSDLTCYYYRSGTADEDMALFFQTLRPNSLQRFEVISKNDIGEKTLTALNVHAESLKTLILGSLSPLAMKSLNLLPKCTALECLVIENDSHHKVQLEAFSDGLLKEIATWIGNCKSLRELTFNHVQDALCILKDVLSTPDIRLASLDVKDFRSTSDEVTTATWTALGLQASLESLTLEEESALMDGFILESQRPLADSICQLTNLAYLNLMQAHVSVAEIRQFSEVLPRLEDFAFGGELPDDSVLEPLSKFPVLKVLSINASSMFTWEGLQAFAQRLNSPGHLGIKVEIMCQFGETKFSDEQEKWLEEYFASTLDGRISITYPLGMDDYHEGDFSESD
ncbi:hypothetical protein F5X99DRAFT_395762 [Biscogniauxia marginata]|nr:hypothetical protein F5X99DRAFT_395762 [Biscogniauxia marginata]